MKRIFIFFYCMYVSFSYAQNVGIGTTTPASGLELKGTGLLTQQRITDVTSGNSLVLQGGAESNLKITGYNYGTGTAKPLYISVDGANTYINSNGGAIGVGTTTLTPGYLIDARGPVRSEGNTTHFVAKTNGGTNSWARFYMQSNSQGWFMGTSENFNGNQLYIGEESNYGTRLSIQPNGGPININGNITQTAGSYGLPKAMVYLNSNGTIGRCYNGISGSSTSGCGFSSVRVNAGNYQISFPFGITTSFFAVSADMSCCPNPVSITHTVLGNATLNIGTIYKDTFDAQFKATDMPVMIIVY